MIKRSKKKLQNIAIVASAHKVGSTWIINILKNTGVYEYSIVPEKFRTNIHNPRLLKLNHPDIDEFIHQVYPGRLFKSHSLPPTKRISDKAKVINIYRDPRDVIISNIFYLAGLERGKGGWPEIKEMNLKKRMKYYMARTHDDKLLENWHGYPDAYHISYEDMLKDPFKVMKGVLNYLNPGYNKRKLKKTVKSQNFEKVSKGRKRGVEDSTSFFRKGVVGDWQNHFSDEIIEFFVNHEKGKWNKLLVKLGYETNNEWHSRYKG
ncbi:MAG: sulfotransferase domain-containing protein [Candidatus Aminicenantes bacterium]|nr:sulfotransferase domain-containing protein [Candidatus Aminicenantes bacterium]